MCTREYCSSAAETGLQLLQQVTSWCQSVTINLFVVFSPSDQPSLRHLAALFKSDALSRLKVPPWEAGILETGDAKLCNVAPRSLLRPKSHPKYFQKAFMYLLQP